MGIIGSIIIGILAGWLAGKLMRGGGYGCVINLLLGLVGGFVGGRLFGLLGIQVNPSWIGELGTAVVGAIVLLGIASLFNKKK
ncbi:MAG: GlsB/YeaQ/YmgE family stress response membrane protein [Prevotella sp.]|nr:GlsB/YeaQ/YmgE family stress response membrane protein [Prevotella sp.]